MCLRHPLDVFGDLVRDQDEIAPDVFEVDDV